MPSKRNNSNYRVYSQEDVARLYQILLFKELEFSLKDIKRILDDEGFDKEEHRGGDNGSADGDDGKFFQFFLKLHGKQPRSLLPIIHICAKI